MTRTLFRGGAVLLALTLCAAPLHAESDAYKNAYAAAKQAGKSEIVAKAYARAFADYKSAGKSDDVSRRYADAFSAAYSSAKNDGKSDNDAEASAAAYGRHAVEKRY